jgi:guanylate kinase
MNVVMKSTSIKNETLLILGKSGSGKDYLTRKLVQLGLKPCIKWTTRPMRKFEKQGITYNFVDENKFKESINNGDFLAYQIFNVTPEGRDPETWYYGITNEEFKNSQVMIITPEELKSITPEVRKGCFVVYLDIERDIRKMRISGRGDKNDSVERRLDADEIDFADFSKNGDYDLRVTDPDFTADDIYDLMA